MIICSNCLEELTPEEIAPGHTICCYAKAYIDDLPFDDLDGYHTYVLAMEQSHSERLALLAHVQSMASDSKKRRKSYSKPTGKASWPGRLWEGTKKPRKKALPPNKKSPSVDIKSSAIGTNIYGDQWQVSIIHPDLEIPEMVTGDDRRMARRKARQFIRDRLDSSIIVADEIIEKGQEITVIFR